MLVARKGTRRAAEHRFACVATGSVPGLPVLRLFVNKSALKSARIMHDILCQGAAITNKNYRDYQRGSVAFQVHGVPQLISRFIPIQLRQQRIPRRHGRPTTRTRHALPPSRAILRYSAAFSRAAAKDTSRRPPSPMSRRRPWTMVRSTQRLVPVGSTIR